MAYERPKHKPQKKRTLDEVLKSLQDLIRNDLVATQNTAEPPAAPPPPTNSTDPLDTALDALDNLIDHELVEPAKQARTAPPPSDDDLPDDADWPDDDTVINESLAAEAAHNPPPDVGKDLAPGEQAVPAEPETPRGAQNTFAFDEALPTDSASGVSADTGVPPAPTAPTEPTRETETNAADVPARAHTARLLPEDDIPVLHEVAHEILAASPTLPTPEQARDIAIHVIARLNIELRKGGAQPLDPSTIDRLQKLLGEALASKKAT